VLQEVMHDAEQLALEEEEEEEMEPPVEKGEEEKGGGGQGAEPGSPAALLDDFIARSGGRGWLYCVNPCILNALGAHSVLMRGCPHFRKTFRDRPD